MDEHSGGNTVAIHDSNICWRSRLFLGAGPLPLPDAVETLECQARSRHRTQNVECPELKISERCPCRIFRKPTAECALRGEGGRGWVGAGNVPCEDSDRTREAMTTTPTKVSAARSGIRGWIQTPAIVAWQFSGSRRLQL